LSEKDGSTYITGDKDTIKAGRRKPNVRISGAQSQDKVVIVGGGSGAIATVEALREAHFKGSITMIGNEGYLPIDRTKLSKALISDPSKLAWRDEEWFKTASVATVHDTVTSVDFAQKTVSTESGSS
jgi:NADH dehydrogenase FAD-containing subunit